MYEIFNTLKRTSKWGGNVRIVYTDTKGQTTQRVVDPIGFRTHSVFSMSRGPERVVNMQAYCYLREQFRYFNVERIQQAEPVPTAFWTRVRRIWKRMVKHEQK